MVEELRRRIERAVVRLVPANRRVLVACSGGPDSRTLLDVLAALAGRLGLQLSVASIDHGLRAESAAEARRVVEIAAGLGLPARAIAITVGKPGMAAARRARYQALVAEAAARGAGAIAAGHTATDQAETLLDRLVRGAGARGLSAMAPSRPAAPGIFLIRPLLDVSAAEIAAYVEERGLDLARDPTNADLSYRRSRLRHQVLPLLRRERPGLDRAIAALCDRLRADADALDAAAARAHAALADPLGGLDAAGLHALDDALAARVVARAAALPLEQVHLDAVRRLCADRRGTRAVDLPGGFVAERRYEKLFFQQRALDPGDLAFEVTAPGRYAFFDGAVDLPDLAFAAARAEGASLWLRNLRPGDRLRLGDRSPKVQDVLVDAKVPRPARRRLPLLVRRHAGGAEEVLWVPGVRACLVRCALTHEGAVQ